jgi:hypothetical protein
MRSHYPESHLFVTNFTGNHHIAAVNPYPHVLSRHQERIAVMAKLATELTVNVYPLAHGNPAGKRHIAVTPLRVLMEGFLRLDE